MIKILPNFIKKPLKKIIYPVIYSYPAYLLYDFIHKLTGYKKEKKLIYKETGYYPDLKKPRSYSEKILYKKIYDRNPLLPIISDKYRVRQYLKEVLGEKEAEKILIPLLYVTNKPDSIPFDDLKGEFIIKPNHASGLHIIVENTENQKKYYINYWTEKTTLPDGNDTRYEIVKICKNWISIPYGFHRHEWAYQKIRRKILIEKLLRDNSGNTPANYDFSVFHGKCHLIAVAYNRFDDTSIARYTPSWEYLNVQSGAKQASYEKKPENLNSMIELAELLGKPFDFIRIDLYLIDNQIYFGELTNYPMSGSVHFSPASFDFEMGSKWRIIPKYWKL